MEHLSTEQILRVLDGKTEQSEQDVIKEHLAACSLCQREMELQEAIAWSMRSQPLTEPFAAFTDQIMAQIAPQPQRRRVRTLKFEWGSAIALCVVLAIGYLFIANTNSPVPSNGIVQHEQTLALPYVEGLNSFGDLFTGGIHTVMGYLMNGSGRMFIGVIFSLSVLLLFDGILSRRITALRR